jgi:hypothetical protein
MYFLRVEIDGRSNAVEPAIFFNSCNATSACGIILGVSRQRSCSADLYWLDSSLNLRQMRSV